MVWLTILQLLTLTAAEQYSTGRDHRSFTATERERERERESYLVFWAASTTENYITAKSNIQFVSYLLRTLVIKPQIIQKPQNQSWHKST